MKKIICLLMLSLAFFACSDSDDDKTVESPLVAIWENKDVDPKFTGWGIGERFIKFEYAQGEYVDRWNFILHFKNAESEKWGFVGCKIDETAKTIFLVNDVLYTYRFIGGDLNISRPETEENYTYKKVSN